MGYKGETGAVQDVQSFKLGSGCFCGWPDGGRVL